VPRSARLAAALVTGAAAIALFPAHAHAAAGESCLVAAVNSARASAGLPALSDNEDLAAVAQSHSQAMAAAGALSHNPDLPSQAPSTWVVLGENVGEGSTCDGIASAFMSDEAHRQNILGTQFNALGVGVVSDATGMLWVTEDFMGTGSTSAQLPPASAPPASAPPASAPPVPAPARPASPAARSAVIPTPARTASTAAGVPRAHAAPSPSPSPFATPRPAVPFPGPGGVSGVAAGLVVGPPSAGAPGAAASPTASPSPRAAAHRGVRKGHRNGHHRGLLARFFDAVGSLVSSIF
jgi:hypothetical protein